MFVEKRSPSRDEGVIAGHSKGTHDLELRYIDRENNARCLFSVPIHSQIGSTQDVHVRMLRKTIELSS